MLAPVSIVIPTLDPNPEWLGRTINSLAAQTQPPDELLIIDVTPGGLPFDTEWTRSEGGCGLCGEQFVASAIEIIEGEGTTVRVYHREELSGLSAQRRFGIREATNEHVGKFDEDTVLLVKTHLERAVNRLEADDDVVAVGCRVAPIRDNAAGHAISRLLDGTRRVPTVNGSYGTAYFAIHATHLCPDGDACFPFEHRGGDTSLSTHLADHGRIVRDEALVALTDLPTRKQARAMRLAGMTTAGGLASGLIAPALQGVW